MGEVTNELLAEMLRRMQSDITDLKADSREASMRMGSMEAQMAQLHALNAEISNRMDRRDDVMERVLRRLELSAAT